MSTNGIYFRLDDSKVTAFDSKLKEKGISKQFFLSKCVELFIEGKLSLDSNKIANDNNELEEIKKQLAIIMGRLDRLEGDSNVIAFDTVIDNKELESDDSNELSNDSLEDKEDIPLEKCTITIENEGNDVIEPDSEDEAVNVGIERNEGIGTLKDAINNVILPEKEKGMSDSAIAKLLHGKYISSKNGNSTNWQGNLVKRALEYRDEGKI